jgi:hypothetical protein
MIEEETPMLFVEGVGLLARPWGKLTNQSH